MTPRQTSIYDYMPPFRQTTGFWDPPVLSALTDGEGNDLKPMPVSRYFAKDESRAGWVRPGACSCGTNCGKVYEVPMATLAFDGPKTATITFIHPVSREKVREVQQSGVPVLRQSPDHLVTRTARCLQRPCERGDASFQPPTLVMARKQRLGGGLERLIGLAFQPFPHCGGHGMDDGYCIFRFQIVKLDPQPAEPVAAPAAR